MIVLCKLLIYGITEEKRMPVSQEKYKFNRISQNPEKPIDLKALYEKAKKKKEND